MPRIDSTPKVSVIIPIYRAENYIEKCCRSLFEQTIDMIEYIFVDDKTPDDSINILKLTLEEYPQRKKQVKIVEMPVNSKQAEARNAGLRIATGEYVIHCDPDDWVDNDLYESLYSVGRRNNADIVTADFVMHLANDTLSKIYKYDFFKPLDLLKPNAFPCLSLCTMLVKRDVIKNNHIEFFKGVNYMEDYGFICRALFVSKSVFNYHGSLYHYNRTNETSITKRINDSDIVEQRISCLKYLDNFFKAHSFDGTTLNAVMRQKRDVKDTFLTLDSLDKWSTLFPEVAHWEFKHSHGSFVFRLVYLISHYIGIWPMRLLLSRSAN